MIKDILMFLVTWNSRAAANVAIDISDYMNRYDLNCMGLYMQDQANPNTFTARVPRTWLLHKRCFKHLVRFLWYRDTRSADRLAGVLVWYMNDQHLQVVGSCYTALATHAKADQ